LASRQKKKLEENSGPDPLTIPILVGSDFGVLGHLWSQNDVNTLRSGIFAPPANALGLSIEEKDLLFCTRIGRWPLPLPSYPCTPANALGLSIEEKDLLFCTCIGRWLHYHARRVTVANVEERR